MEKWDLFDENRLPLNKTHDRAEKMISGEYHTVVDVWTVNSREEILLTLRHPNKKDYPNCWENTGGSALVGETSKEGAIRELFEETGIKVVENELRYLGTKKEETAFVDTYIVRKDVQVIDLIMQDGETIGAQWVTLDKLDEMINIGTIAFPVAERLKPLRSKFENFLFFTK
jgi:8-oxo-dGTP diphosphatase